MLILTTSIKFEPIRASLLSIMSLVLAMNAEAAFLTINNPSFESPTTASGTFSGGQASGPTDWTVYNSGATNNERFFGVWNPSTTSSFVSGAPDGANVGVVFLENTTNLAEAGLQQTLAASLQLSTQYTLTVEVGNFSDAGGGPFDFAGFPGYRVELFAGGTLLASDDNMLSPGEGIFETSVVTFSTRSSHANAGQPLAIRLVNLNGPGIEVNFDNVRLDATPVPGPSVDDIAPLSDEFDDASTFSNWQDLGIVEGWNTPSYETADIDTTEPGRFHIIPGQNSWFAHLRGLLFFKEVTGDFVATMRVRVFSRHNPADPTEVPNRSFSLTGIFVHGPRPGITQAAPSPYTTDAVWPPADFGSDYIPNTENYIFLSYGTAGNPGTRQFEIKATRNSSSRLYFNSTGIDQSQTEAWLQMVRVGDTVVCLRKHTADGAWYVENRYPNADHPFPDFGATLQVGITAYTDWPTAAPFNNGGLESSYHFNYAPPQDGSPDLISQVDYYRLCRPDPALTEAVLQNMSVSYNPAGNFTLDPPVQLSASAGAAPYLGENANHIYDPFGDWQTAEFGADADLPLAAAAADPDGDGLTNAEEFVLGGNPQQSDTAPLPTSSSSPTSFTYRFTPVIDNGAQLGVQLSANLGEWTTIASRPRIGGDWQNQATVHELTIDPTTGEVSVELPAPADRTFVRLQITL